MNEKALIDFLEAKITVANNGDKMTKSFLQFIQAVRKFDENTSIEVIAENYQKVYGKSPYMKRHNIPQANKAVSLQVKKLLPYVIKNISTTPQTVTEILGGEYNGIGVFYFGGNKEANKYIGDIQAAHNCYLRYFKEAAKEGILKQEVVMSCRREVLYRFSL